MKRIAASVGLVALGASGLQAADTVNLSSLQVDKPWSVSATLRGFYDDNINTTKNNKVHAFGYEISPSLSLSMPGERTSASLGYTYSGKYFDHALAGGTDKWAHTHTFDAGLSHTFSPQVQVGVKDSFVVGQEPDVLRSGDTFATFQRISGDNMRNYGAIVLSAEVTPLLGFEAGYDNSWYDYDDEGVTTVAGNVVPSNSGTLDRMEHSGHIDSRWHILPQTTGIFGYKYSQTDYQGDEAIQGNVGIPASLVTSNARNSRSHFFYAGTEHTFTPDLSGSAKLGAQYIDYFNSTIDSEWSPYAQASVRYLYMVESSVDLGVVHQRSASDVVGPGGNQGGAAAGNFVHDQEATTAYGTIRHRIVPNLFGSLTGTFQHSTFNGGVGFDGQTDNFFLVGLNFEYRFNPHLSAHAGYNYDRLDSDIGGRSFSRNRIYVGLTAAY